MKGNTTIKLEDKKTKTILCEIIFNGDEIKKTNNVYLSPHFKSAFTPPTLSPDECGGSPNGELNITFDGYRVGYIVEEEK